MSYDEGHSDENDEDDDHKSRKTSSIHDDEDEDEDTTEPKPISSALGAKKPIEHVRQHNENGVKLSANDPEAEAEAERFLKFLVSDFDHGVEFLFF